MGDTIYLSQSPHPLPPIPTRLYIYINTLFVFVYIGLYLHFVMFKYALCVLFLLTLFKPANPAFWDPYIFWQKLEVNSSKHLVLNLGLHQFGTLALCYDMFRLSSLAKFKTAIKNKLHCNDEAFFNWYFKLLLLVDFTMILFELFYIILSLTFALLHKGGGGGGVHMSRPIFFL